MKIVPYEPSMVDGLTLHENASIAGVPHCYPIEDGDRRDRPCWMQLKANFFVVSSPPFEPIRKTPLPLLRFQLRLPLKPPRSR